MNQNDDRHAVSDAAALKLLEKLRELKSRLKALSKKIKEKEKQPINVTKYHCIMRITAFLLVITLSSSCLNNDKIFENQISELKKENELLKAEIQELKFGADHLYRKGLNYFENDSLDLARAVFSELIKKYPDYEKREEVDIKQQELTEIYRKQQEEKDKLIKAATKNMRVSKDEINNITWYYDNSTPKYNWTKNMHLYIGKQEGTKPFLRLRIRYTSDDWLFIDKYIFKIDEETITIIPESRVDRDNGAGDIWEWYDVEVDSEQLAMVQKIIDSKKTQLRYSGRTYYSDRTISSTEKKAMKNILSVYESLGGVLPKY